MQMDVTPLVSAMKVYASQSFGRMSNPMRKRVCIIGAGFTGAVIAHELACAGIESDVFESRGHVGGNCHTERDTETGVMVHKYGPHIFHTNQEHVWNYVRRFDEMCPFINRVKAVSSGQVFSLPINLMTINQFFGKAYSPEQARHFLDSLGLGGEGDPKSFEDQALRFVGTRLYEAFFKGYTQKQWGVSPGRLPASILKRLPIRFSYDDNYYDSRFQGIPRHGYTSIVEKMLDRKEIHVHLNQAGSQRLARGYSHSFFTGPLDQWFGFSAGRLGYRTLDFEVERHHGDWQGNPVINYCDLDVPWTRVCEHKHLSPWESHEETLIYREFSRSCNDGDVPFYPIRLVDDRSLLDQYAALVRKEPRVSFAGRLATYRYLDMDVAIEEALAAARCYLIGLGIAA